MNPTEAVNHLVQAGWTEAEIARKAGIQQPAVNKIKHGRMPLYDTGFALVKLAGRVRKPRGDIGHG
jgi:transcriptional regulator with XRE-family HTH domain